MTDPISQVAFDFNLALMDDEALVVLAQECKYGPARDELLVRYDGHTKRLIRWLASSTEFTPADIDDAEQNAVFWTIEAIQKYDTEQMAKERGCSFRSFSYRVVVARFKDFAKHLRRVEHRYNRAVRPSGDDLPAIAIGHKTPDPAWIAESQEALRRLRKTLAQLDEESRRVWDLLADGAKLREISAKLNISYDAAKRRRRKLIAHLAEELSPCR